MAFTCPQFEERLTDYIDSALSAEETRLLEEHAQRCAQCGPLYRQVSALVGQMRTIEPVQLPPHLTPRILELTLGPRANERRPHGWLGGLQWLFRPQFALGAAAAALSLAVILQFAIPPRMKKDAMAPMNIIHNVNRQAHLVYARGVKYVNDLRVVYEIQSRLQPEPAPEAPGRNPQATPQDKSEQEDQDPGRSANSAYLSFAVVLMPASGRNMP